MYISIALADLIQLGLLIVAIIGVVLANKKK